MATDSVLTKNGMKILLNRAYKTVPDYNIVSDFKLSDDTSIFLETDTDVEENIIPITGMETVDACDAADWTEDGVDATAETVNSSSFKEGTGSLNLGKTGATSASFSYSKTTTSVNGTSKDLCVWVYITDLTDFATSSCLTIRFGSDSSNYYQKTYDKADLSTGWNFLKIAISSGFDSTTGSPTITALDYSYIAFTMTSSAITVTLGDILMDYWHVVSADDYIKALESGYPSIDETNLIVTLRGKVTSTMANGHAIAKIGWFNDDGTPLMEGGANFNPISKENTDLLYFVTKRRIRNKV